MTSLKVAQDMISETQFITRVAVDAALGAEIGIKRELKHKPIGLRTNALIAMTGTLVMILANAISPSEG